MLATRHRAGAAASSRLAREAGDFTASIGFGSMLHYSDSREYDCN
jgi:hypothetical protein